MLTKTYMVKTGIYCTETCLVEEEKRCDTAELVLTSDYECKASCPFWSDSLANCL